MKTTARKSEKQSRSHRRRSPAETKSAPALSKDRIWFLALFGGAFFVRLVYLSHIESMPLFYHLPGDPRAYDEWAQRIAAGDWSGQGVFYQAPLYPYFLGVLQSLLGHDLWGIRLLQIGMGSLACALIFVAGRSLISRAAGIAAGLILAVYAPAIFFDGLIEKSVLDLFFLAVFLALAGSALDKPRWFLWLAMGATVALLGLSRENALVLAAVVAVWIFFGFRTAAWGARLRWALGFFAGLLLVLLPVGLRNLTVGGEFKLTTSQLGANFFIGNNPAADGTYGSVGKALGEPQLEGKDAKRLAERAAGRELSPGAVSDYWLRRSLDYIRSQPIHWFGLLVKKWLMVWNSREIEDSDDFYVYRQWSWLLNILAWLANFGVLAPLAAVGLWCTRDQWRRLWLLYAMIFILSLSVAVFFVFGRYRYPLVPVLVLFAGATVAELWRRYETRNWKGSTALVVIFLLVATVVNWPIYGQRGPGPGGYNNLSNAYYKQGNVELAVTYARKALEMAPDHGVTHYNLANLYANQGAYDLARRHFKEALRIYPDFADAHSNLGQLVAERGDLETGVKHFRRAIEIDPSVIRAHLNLGVSLAKQGRSEEALLPLSEAVRLAPDSAEYHYYLGSVFAELGRFNDAERAFKNALTVRSDFVPAHESLAQLLSSQGKREAALRHLEEARRIRSREKPQRMR